MSSTKDKKKPQQALPIGTPKGEPNQEVPRRKDPYYLSPKGGKKYLSEMSDGELMEAVDELDAKANGHRKKILELQHSILKLLRIKNKVSKELQGRNPDVGLLIPIIEIAGPLEGTDGGA